MVAIGGKADVARSNKKINEAIVALRGTDPVLWSKSRQRTVPGPSEQLAPLSRVTLRRMFGKSGVFYDGVMFAMVTENTLESGVSGLSGPFLTHSGQLQFVGVDGKS
jgi:hypothetical protein